MQGKYNDLAGRRFNRLTVLRRAPRPSSQKSRGARWVCLCDCGNEHTALGQSLTQGNTQSCGCLHDELNRTRAIRHGAAPAGNETSEYRVWKSMITRCTNPKRQNYDRYGGRGIKVCDRWRTFENFLADIGPRPSLDYTLDRINGDGDYEPGNVRWATATVQSRNQKDVIWITYEGRTLAVTDWADETGLHPNTIRHRFKKGWTPKAILTTPPKPGGRPTNATSLPAASDTRTAAQSPGP